MVEAPAVPACLWIRVCATKWQGGGTYPRARDVLVPKDLARYIFLLACAACWLAPNTIAIAQPTSDPYVSLGTGVSLQQILSRAPTQAPSPNLQPDPKFAARFSIDWGSSKPPGSDPKTPATRAAATVPPRTYPVFFDWDRTDLSARARQIIAAAASASSQFPTTRIEINGYTDPSGGAQYNKRLASQRGESVHAELLRDGVPPDEIAVTVSGTKNRQLSRVEIVLR